MRGEKKLRFVIDDVVLCKEFRRKHIAAQFVNELSHLEPRINVQKVELYRVQVKLPSFVHMARAFRELFLPAG